MKTSFHGNKILYASAFAGVLVSLCSVISTACGKYSAQIKRWNAKYEYENARLASLNALNEKNANAVN